MDPRLGQTVGNYRIARSLGSGGMGMVYLADDLANSRPVALKFLGQELLASEIAKTRFAREARAGIALAHPNLCQLYGVGETPDGELFIAMAYYDGETLQRRLKRAPMDLAESLDISCQIARGLAAAHDAGIVHRDIKPANVMLIAGGVKILDFGIAKLADQEGLTRPGAALGTAAYVSPEQAEGKTIDQRTDIWALGVVLYEMVTGRRPFDVEHFPALIYAARTLRPARPRELARGVSLELDVAIMRALAVSRDERPQSIRELLRVLDEERRTVPRRGAPAEATVVLTPPAATTGTDASLAGAVGEALAYELQQLAPCCIWRAPAGRASFQGRVMRGEVEESPAGLRISVRVERDGGVAVAARAVQGARADVARLIRELAGELCGALDLSLHAPRQPAAFADGADAEGYLSCFLGRWRMTDAGGADDLAALSAFDSAASRAPNEGLPRAGIVLARLALLGSRCPDDRETALDRISAACRDLETRRQVTEVSLARAAVGYRVEGAVDAAESAVREFLTSQPYDSRGSLLLAECLAERENLEGAVRAARGAIARNPLSPSTLVQAGRILFMAKAIQPSVRAFREATTLVPDWAAPWLDLAVTLSKMDDREGAWQACDRGLDLVEGRAMMAAALGCAARGVNNRTQYEALSRELQTLQRQVSLSPCHAGLLNASFGESGVPLEYLDTYDDALGLAKFLPFTRIAGSVSAFRESLGLIAYLGIDPRFAILWEARSVRQLLKATT